MSVYAMSDLHGVKDLYGQVKAFLKPEDTVYFLGDAGDRGPQSWECIKLILNDPQFIYLKGNHEDMLCKALKGWLKTGTPNYKDVQLVCWNGGQDTFNDAIKDPDIKEIYTQLLNLPTYVKYKANDESIIHLSHAGFSPPGWFDNTFQTHDLLWDREHFFEDWEGEENEYVVHGHTPVPHLIKELRTYKVPYNFDKIGACYYCDGHKICIDNASFSTGITCLLDLNSFDEYIFTTDPNLLY